MTNTSATNIINKISTDPGGVSAYPTNPSPSVVIPVRHVVLQEITQSTSARILAMSTDDSINKKRPISPDSGDDDDIINKQQRTKSPAPKPPPEALGSPESYVSRGAAVIWAAVLNALNIENPTHHAAPKTPVDDLATLLQETFLNYLTIERSQEEMGEYISALTQKRKVTEK